MEQISMERDKARVELEKVEKRNLQLFKEVDDHHSALEHHNENKLKYVNQPFNKLHSSVGSWHFLSMLDPCSVFLRIKRKLTLATFK